MANLKRLYAVTWRRSGQSDTFKHHVIADDDLTAQRISNAQVWIFLGSDRKVWELESVGPIRSAGAPAASAAASLLG